MAPPTKSDNKLQVRQQRRVRLEAELRANLHKRKAQARSRQQLRDMPDGAGEGDQPDTEAGPGARERLPEGRLTRGS